MKIVTHFRIALGSLAVCAGANACAAFFFPGSTAFQVAASALGMGVMIYLWIMTYTRLERPFKAINACAEQTAQGDFTARVCYSSDDELGYFVRKMQAMTESVGAMVATAQATAGKAAETVNALAHRAERSSAGARNQAEQSGRIAAAAEEMSRTIADISKNASAGTEQSRSTMTAATHGKSVAENAGETVNRVFRATATLAEMIKKLNASAGEISGIVTVIKGIADQTNMLALNAAIEAARAGEQGRGFAVVADEVRKLAERTISATEDISGRIGAVQQESLETTRSMETASTEVVTATEEIKKVSGALDTIFDGVRTMQDQISRIAAAMEQQSEAAEEVSGNVEQLASIARDIDQLSGDISRDMQALLREMETLRNALERFKV